MSESAESSKVSGIKIALAVVPALLIVSICVALYLGASADKEEQTPYEGEVMVAEMSGYLKNLNEVIGERRIDTEEGRFAFRQINAMTMGALGPENLGYEIFRTRSDSVNGLLWSTIWVQAGDRDTEEIVVVAIPQAESGTGPAFAFGFAEYLASTTTTTGVRIVFYPPLVEGDLADWVWERCGSEGEELKGFVKVTGGDSKDRETLFFGPDGADVLREMQESKLWGRNFVIGKEASPFFEVLLVERGRFSSDEHAFRLIQALPVVKGFVERLGRE